MRRYPCALLSLLGLTSCLQTYDADDRLCIVPTTNNTSLISQHIAQEIISPPQSESKKKEKSSLDLAVENMESTSIAALPKKNQKVDFKIEFNEDDELSPPEPLHTKFFSNDIEKTSHP